MAKPWVPYVVRPGEHLHGLAFRFGSDVDTIWKDPKNADLASKRKNRDMLSAGDILFVPPEPPPPLPLTAGTTNAYSANVPKTHVSLHLDARPTDRIANKAYEVHGTGGKQPIEGTVSSDGKIEFDVPVNVRSVEILVPEAGMRAVVLVGELDPIDEPGGVIQRLRNLGFLHGSGEVPDDVLRHALGAFQQNQGLVPDGELTPATLDALRDAHKS
jgi:hypothetical protein